MSTATYATTIPAEGQTIEEYRRYPQPELLHLPLRRSPSPTPPSTSSSAPAEPVAPRNRSTGTGTPNTTTATASSLSSSSPGADADNAAAVTAEGVRGGAPSTASASSSSSFTEAMPEEERVEEEEPNNNSNNNSANRGIHHSSRSHSGNEGDDAGGNENKRGDYKSAPVSATVTPPRSPAPQADASNVEHHEQDASASGEAVPSAQALVIDVRLRWGFQTDDLRRVYAMHEDAFPLSYGPSYYEWLLNHDACMALVATVTPTTYATLVEQAAAKKKKRKDEEGKNETGVVPGTPLTWFPGYTPTAAEAAAGGPRPVPVSASRRRLTVEIINERAQVDSTLTELEYIDKNKTEKAAQSTHGGEASSEATTAETKKEGNEDNLFSDSAYTEVVGFILGQCAYARHDAGHLLTNPTVYIGSFVVDPCVQRCGLGSVLLQRFLVYVTQQRPVYAQDYLHYDERKLIAMLVKAQLRKRKDKIKALEKLEAASRHKKDDDVDIPQGGETGSPATTTTTAATATAPNAVSNTAATSVDVLGGVSTFVQQCVAAYLPEAATWWEDRQARQRLRASGMPEDEIDAQRFRDRLAPDDLTDEEAEEVRRQAQGFVVQTGIREVWLHCLPGNMAATQLYAHRGFTLHRVLRDYYDIDGERYDANLLLYVSPIVRETGMEAVVQNHNSRVTSQNDEAAAADAAAATNAQTDADAGSPSDPKAAVTAAAPAASAGEGMRRRHTEASKAAAAAPQPDTPSTEPNAAPASATPTEGTTTSNTAAAGPSDGAQQPPTAASSWLTPRSYATVADIILCTAAEGQEEWQRRFGGSGDVTGRRSWWETTKEVLLLVNAFGLLCAVLWLAYNVGLTGKVE